MEAILKASATIDDSMVVKFGGKEASVFAEEWFKTTGRAFLRKWRILVVGLLIQINHQVRQETLAQSMRSS